MPEPKAQLVDPQGPIDVPGMQVTGVTTATGGFVGQVQGTATGFAATTYNLNVGIVTATKFQGNTTGNVSGLACLLYTSPSPRDRQKSRMPSSA